MFFSKINIYIHYLSMSKIEIQEEEEEEEHKQLEPNFDWNTNKKLENNLLISTKNEEKTSNLLLLSKLNTNSINNNNNNYKSVIEFLVVEPNEENYNFKNQEYFSSYSPNQIDNNSNYNKNNNKSSLGLDDLLVKTKIGIMSAPTSLPIVDHSEKTLFIHNEQNANQIQENLIFSRNQYELEKKTKKLKSKENNKSNEFVELPLINQLYSSSSRDDASSLKQDTLHKDQKEESLLIKQDRKIEFEKRK